MSNAKTKGGEPTFGVPAYKSVLVEDRTGMQSVAYHDDDTWWIGHHSETQPSGGKPGRAAVQLERAPVKLA